MTQTFYSKTTNAHYETRDTYKNVYTYESLSLSLSTPHTHTSMLRSPWVSRGEASGENYQRDVMI